MYCIRISLKYIFNLDVFAIMVIDNFYYNHGQSLQNLTVTKGKMQTK
jgi:hypothetical protein